MLIGIPFALGLGSRHGKIISFTFALIFSFLYWGLQAMGQSFGENRVISPFAAAWLGNFVFGTAGIYLAGKIKK
jgi:lipopolysaccharide export LptBFGC system permease protein LptF